MNVRTKVRIQQIWKKKNACRIGSPSRVLLPRINHVPKKLASIIIKIMTTTTNSYPNAKPEFNHDETVKHTLKAVASNNWLFSSEDMALIPK